MLNLTRGILRHNFALTHKLTISLLLIAYSLFGLPVFACGPYMDSSFVDNGGGEIQRSPNLPYGLALDRIKGQQRSPFQAKHLGEDDQTFDVGVKDVQEALTKTGYPTEKQKKLLTAYSITRRQMTKNRHQYAVLQEQMEYHQYKLTQVKPGAGVGPAPSLTGVKQVIIPVGLPKEFELYLKGANAWYQQNQVLARSHWKAILALPEKQRYYRETWALFMLGKSHEGEESLAYFNQLRNRVKAGAYDSLGLAAASYGEEGRMHYERGEYEQAILAYWQQYLTGDPGAAISLRYVFSRFFNPKENSPDFIRMIQNPKVRLIINAYLIGGNSGRWGYHIDLDKRGVWARRFKNMKQLSSLETEQLALLSFQSKQDRLALHYLNLPSADSSLCHWLRAKLLTKQGKLKEATASYTQALNKDGLWVINHDDDLAYREWYDRDARSQLAGELALIKLHEQDWTNATLLFLRFDHSESAAYIAERVMTLKETQAFVDQYLSVEQLEKIGNEKDKEHGYRGYFYYWPASEGYTPYYRNGYAMRHLLARRLMRANQPKKALPYLPDELRQQLEKYIEYRQQFVNRQVPARQRAEALFAASGIIREHGMELMGTTFEPDWFLRGGNYDFGEVSRQRILQSENNEVLAPSPIELARLQIQPAYTMDRFHYRFLASDLAWMACKLMPDHDPRTAEMLWISGRWIMYLDPDRADRFYRALVKRCPQTALGKAAEATRWFPKSNPEKEAQEGS